MEKQTAVQCLIDQIRFSSKGTFYAMKKSGFFEEAEEMEKQQIMETYFAAIKSTGEGWNGEYAGTNHFSIEETFNGDFQNYYNETFGGKDE